MPSRSTRNSAVTVCVTALFVFVFGCGTGGSIGSEISFGQEAPAGALLRGFYPPSPAWSWTQEEFAFILRSPADADRVFLELDFAFPEELAEVHPEITLTARVNGLDAGAETFRGDGRYIFSKEIPDKGAPGGAVEVLFQVSDTVEIDGEERGIIAVSAAFRTYEHSAQYRREQLEAANRGYEELLEKRRSKFPVEEQKEIMKVFHELGIWDDLHFHGVKIVKNPLDLWMMQQIIYDVRPDFIIETGAGRGGSSLYWAQILNGMGLTESQVITVDIEDNTAEARKDPLWNRYVTFFLGSSTDTNIVEQISQMVQGGRVVVCLDSDNSMEHVLDELRLYSPFVSPGSYIVVEDTHYDAVPTAPELGPGPAAAVRAFLAEGGADKFEPDISRETLILSSNPGGFLRRK